MSHGSWTPPRKREEHGRPGRAETDPIARAMPMRDDNQCLHGRDAHAPLAFVSHTLSSHFRISEPESTPMSHWNWTPPRKREEHGRPGRAETDPIASHTHPNQKDTRSQARRPRHTVGQASRLTPCRQRPQARRPRHISKILNEIDPKTIHPLPGPFCGPLTPAYGRRTAAQRSSQPPTRILMGPRATIHAYPER